MVCQLPIEPLCCQYPEQESNLQTLGDQPSVGARAEPLCPLAYLGIKWSRMELNHRFLDVSQASLPLDHGTELKDEVRMMNDETAFDPR